MRRRYCLATEPDEHFHWIRIDLDAKLKIRFHASCKREMAKLHIQIPEDQRSCNAHLRPKPELIYVPSLLLVAYLNFL